MRSKIKWTVPLPATKGLARIVPDPSKASLMIALLARVCPAEKLSALVMGIGKSAGQTVTRPEPVGEATVMFATTAVAESGTSQCPAISIS
jgi:hypothetical protein